jgi:hypothetical protein
MNTHIRSTAVTVAITALAMAGVAVSASTQASATACHKAYTVKGHYVAAHKVKAHYATSSKGKRYYVKAYTEPRHYVKAYNVKTNCTVAQQVQAAFNDGYTDGVANEKATHEVPPKSPGTGTATVVAYNKGWIAGETAYYHK